MKNYWVGSVRFELSAEGVLGLNREEVEVVAAVRAEHSAVRRLKSGFLNPVQS